VKAGVPLTDIGDTPGFAPIGAGFYSESFSITNPYVIGPTTEFRLPLSLAIELDALYRHLDYSSASNYISFSASKLPASAWEFPLMLKYCFPTRGVRPYLSAGISWEFLNTGYEQTVPPPPPGGILNTQQRLYAGFVTGGGADIHVLFFHLSPEIRYTRWGNDFLERTVRYAPGSCNSTGPGPPVNEKQAEFLLGITF
jgi:hypothetical protein